MSSMSYDTLVREIDRITTCPYPSQLRTLNELVKRCSDADISQWATSNSCAVGTLSRRLLDGLQQWPYVLGIISRFAIHQLCRDEFLRRAPTLLQSCVAQAVKPGGSQLMYIHASVALLQLPVPESIVLPAAVETLFVQVVEAAAAKPCVTSIEPVYLLLSGVGNTLLATLSPETLIHFEERLLSIPRSSSGTPDQCLSLYCLAVMNLVCSYTASKSRLAPGSDEVLDFLAGTPTSPRWKSDAMQQFFIGSKAPKSLQLLVLLTLWALSSSSSGEPMAEKTRSLVLANEVIHAIPLYLRRSWCKSNAITVRKLQEKLCSTSHQDDPVKLLALRFLGKLCELDTLPSPILESIQHTFCDPQSLQLMHGLCPQLRDDELFTSLLGRRLITALLLNAVECTISDETAECTGKLDAFADNIYTAKVACHERKISGREIPTMLQDDAFLRRLNRLRELLQESPVQHARSSAGCCPTVVYQKRSKLAYEVSEFLLRACDSSSTTPQTVTLLLDLHGRATRENVPCIYEWPSSRDHVTLRADDIDDSTNQTDWKVALRTHFKARALAEEDAVTTIFAKACASLEARCEEVEEPLRVERERRRAAEQQNNTLAAIFSKLELRNEGLDSRVRELTEERDHYLRNLEETRDENTEVLERIAKLQQDARDAHAQGKERLTKLEEARQLDELDHAAAIASKEEKFEDLQEKLGQIVRDFAIQENLISALQRDIAIERNKVSLMEEEIALKDSQIEKNQAELHELKRTVEQLGMKNTGLNDDLSLAKVKSIEQSERLNDAERQLVVAQAEHEKTRVLLAQSGEEAASRLNSLEAQLSSANRQIKDHVTARGTLGKDLSTLQETTARLTSDLSARHTRVRELKNHNTHLQRKCEQKDQQIAEAETMRTNLMAAMGFHKNRETESRGTLFSLRSQELDTQIRTSTPLEQAEQKPSATTLTTALDDSFAFEDSIMSYANNSIDHVLGWFEAQAPTPKRPKPRKHAPFSRTTSSRASILGSAEVHVSPGVRTRTQDVQKRHTLAVISGNVQTTTSHADTDVTPATLVKKAVVRKTPGKANPITDLMREHDEGGMEWSDESFAWTLAEGALED